MAIILDCTTEDEKIIRKISDRCFITGLISKSERLGVCMDLIATHCNGTPLNFKKLLEFDNVSFQYDISGIRLHISRSTGKLMNSFRPRSAQ